MTGLSASEKLWRNDDVIHTILDQLTRNELVRISPLSKAFQTWVGKYLYRSVKFDLFKHTLQKDTAWTREYCAAVQHVDANQSAAHQGLIDTINCYLASRPLFSPLTLLYVQDRCPNLRSIRQDQNYNDRKDKWVVTFGEDGRIKVDLTQELHFYLDRDFVGQPVLHGGMEREAWRRIDVSVSVGLGDSYEDYAGVRILSRPTFEEKYWTWLRGGNGLPKNLTRLRLTHMPITLGDITVICDHRLSAGLSPIEEVHVTSAYPFSLGVLNRFLDTAGKHLRVLILQHLREGKAERPILHLLDMAAVVDAVKSKCPILERLELAFTGDLVPPSSLLPDHMIPLPQADYGGSLRFVGFSLYDDIYAVEPEQTPIFALVRSMACLGASECHYETRVIEQTHHSSTRLNAHSIEIGRLVRYLQSLPKHVVPHIRGADFTQILAKRGLEYPAWNRLLQLKYEPDGRPINWWATVVRNQRGRSWATVFVVTYRLKQLDQWWEQLHVKNKELARFLYSKKHLHYSELDRATKMLHKVDDILADIGVPAEFYGCEAEYLAARSDAFEKYRNKPFPEVPQLSTGHVYFGSALHGYPPADRFQLVPVSCGGPVFPEHEEWQETLEERIATVVGFCRTWAGI